MGNKRLRRFVRPIIFLDGQELVKTPSAKCLVEITMYEDFKTAQIFQLEQTGSPLRTMLYSKTHDPNYLGTHLLTTNFPGVKGSCKFRTDPKFRHSPQTKEFFADILAANYPNSQLPWFFKEHTSRIPADSLKTLNIEEVYDFYSRLVERLEPSELIVL